MYKLAIDAGHGMNTAGKRCLKSLDPAETREWWLNQRIASKLEALLARYDGISVMRMDDVTGVVDVSISGASSRQKKANAWGADFYLSIHHNAGINGGSGGGIIVIVYPTAEKNTRDWQRVIYATLLAEGGLKGNRATPLAKKDLAVLRETSMAAVLVECGFMDSSVDVPVILSDDYARSIDRKSVV